MIHATAETQRKNGTKSYKIHNVTKNNNME